MKALHLPGNEAELRKQRGAFFTPYPIAEFLVSWATAGRSDACVLDPTCGEGVFLLAAARRLAAAGASSEQIAAQLRGVDLHSASLDETARLLAEDGLAATLIASDFFDLRTPAQLEAPVPWVDAVVGNPPFVRYHEHRGHARRRSAAAALAQGVPLSGLASSWAAMLVHASAFLKPEGRVAMVLPAELLTVGYAEPVRRWLRRRFASVHLVFFDRLVFNGAEEQVVLLVARGSGGCDAFALHEVRTAEELKNVHAFDSTAAAPRAEGKWTDLLLPADRRSLFRRVVGEHYCDLAAYGTTELGTVTGANSFFALTEGTRREYGITPAQLSRIVPPGAKHIRGTRFAHAHWEQLRLKGSRVWLLNPQTDMPSGGLKAYIAHGASLKIDEAYKCSVRSPWWRPPVVRAPDLFFTYMSDTYPRLVSNDTDVTIVNSVHGVVLDESAPGIAKAALPLLAINSVTMLGAELNGRSYGGGILKMEPREAALLPVPAPDQLRAAWERIEPQRSRLDELVRAGQWRMVADEIDAVLLGNVMGLTRADVVALRSAAASLRARRRREVRSDDG